MKLLIVFLLFVSCPTTNNTTLQQDTIKAKLSDTFTIKIPSSIGTGYTWQFQDTVNNRFVSLEKKEYKEGATDKDGATGIDVFTFKAQQKGSTDLHFKYLRNWQKEKTAKEERSFKVVIE